MTKIQLVLLRNRRIMTRCSKRCLDMSGSPEAKTGFHFGITVGMWFSGQYGPSQWKWSLKSHVTSLICFSCSHLLVEVVVVVIFWALRLIVALTSFIVVYDLSLRCSRPLRLAPPCSSRVVSYPLQLGVALALPKTTTSVALNVHNISPVISVTSRSWVVLPINSLSSAALSSSRLAGMTLSNSLLAGFLLQQACPPQPAPSTPTLN